jgi:hypothetical protein
VQNYYGGDNVTNEEIVRSLAENTQRCKSNSHRIDALERDTVVLNKMVTALEVLATQQKSMADKVEKIDTKVTRLETAPLKKISSMIGYILAALCSAAVGAFLGFNV